MLRQAALLVLVLAVAGANGRHQASCSRGVKDSSYSKNNCSDPDVACSAYTGDFTSPKDEVWLVVLGGATMAAMAFGIGGNDVANSWATSVGSGAIPLKWACLLAGVMNWLGAVTLGYGVSSKITKGVAKTSTPECWACGYCDSLMSVYAVGMLGSLVGGALFLLVAIRMKLPVSTTHAIVGGVVGVTVGGVGGSCLNPDFDGGLGGIMASWVISPLLAGLIGCIMYWATNFLVFKSSNPRGRALLAMPVLYSLTIFIMIFLILVKAGPTKKGDKGVMALIALAFAAATFVFSMAVLKPWVARHLPSVAGEESEDSEDAGSAANPAGARPASGLGAKKTTLDVDAAPAAPGYLEVAAAGAPGAPASGVGVFARLQLWCSSNFGREADERARERTAKVQQAEIDNMTVEEKDAMYVFRHLLVFIATCESFAHGANDTANSTAAFSQIVNAYENGIHACSKQNTPWWIMAIAGGFVFLGICTVGYRVIERVGHELTAINFQRGFCMEFGSTMSIIIATMLEMPVSTTHCQIGAVFFVGIASFGVKEVHWHLIAQILASWIFTIPIAGAISATLTAAGGFWMMDYRDNAAYTVDYAAYAAGLNSNLTAATF